MKVPEALQTFREMVIYYGIEQILWFIEKKKISSWTRLSQTLPAHTEKTRWRNIGGQLMSEKDLASLMKQIRSGKISNWDGVHEFYLKKSAEYPMDKFRHAWSSLLEMLRLTPAKFTRRKFSVLLDEALKTREKMVEGIFESRAKDYQSEFRRMVYDSEEEMVKVLGRLENNTFIREQKEELEIFRTRVRAAKKLVG